jgi:hypothetical protein
MMSGDRLQPVWLGLKNSDDQGTRFDLRAEIYRNGVLLTSGETYCIQNLTRNANQAKEVTTTFAAFNPATMNGASDTLSLKVLTTRIGTNGSGAFCGGHSNAVGATAVLRQRDPACQIWSDDRRQRRRQHHHRLQLRSALSSHRHRLQRRCGTLTISCAANRRRTDRS